MDTVDPRKSTTPEELVAPKPCRVRRHNSPWNGLRESFTHEALLGVARALEKAGVSSPVSLLVFVCVQQLASGPRGERWAG